MNQYSGHEILSMLDSYMLGFSDGFNSSKCKHNNLAYIAGWMDGLAEPNMSHNDIVWRAWEHVNHHWALRESFLVARHYS